MTLEKSSKIRISNYEKSLYEKGVLPKSIELGFGINSFEELRKAVEAGEFEIEESIPLTDGN